MKFLFYSVLELVLVGCQFGLLAMIVRLHHQGLGGGWQALILLISTITLFIVTALISTRLAPLWKRVIAWAYEHPPEFNYTGSDFYCDIAIPRKVPLDVLYESSNVLAFRHTRPHWPVHVVVVPKKHIPSFTKMGPEDTEIFQEMVTVMQGVAGNVELEHGKARILTNLGEYQDSRHLHFHINSGDPLK